MLDTRTSPNRRPFRYGELSTVHLGSGVGHWARVMSTNHPDGSGILHTFQHELKSGFETVEAARAWLEQQGVEKVIELE